MEKYTRALERFRKAYRKFEEVISNNILHQMFKEEFLIEITTKRFEYTYEAMWKVSKEFLKLRGIECNSPKSCFKELIKEGIVPLEFENLLYDIILIRNLLVHTYDEEQAKDIYKTLKDEKILKLFETVLNKMETE